MDMKLEVAIVPVSDVDRAKKFYEKLGWRLDADISGGPNFRVVQFTPPGSDASIWIGKGVTSSPPGSQNLLLAVHDVLEARAELVSRGATVSEVYHRSATNPRAPGPDPERKSYSSLAEFKDPDGNGWLLQEIRERLPGRGSTPPAA